MRGNAHVRFGGRAGETHITRVAQGAPVRPYYFNVRLQKDRLACWSWSAPPRTATDDWSGANPVITQSQQRSIVGRQRSAVAGVEGLQQVRRLSAAT